MMELERESPCVRGGSSRGGSRQAAEIDREQLLKGLSYARLGGSDFILKAKATFRARQGPHQICIFKRQLCWQCQRLQNSKARNRETSVKNQNYSPKRAKYSLWQFYDSEY